MESKRPAIPTVSRALPDGSLVELLYKPEQQTTGFAVWDGKNVAIEESLEFGGTTLVPISPGNNLLKHEAVLLPDGIEEYGSIAELVADIGAYFDRYVDLTPDFRLVAIYYILFTWVHDAFNELPYLRLRGDFGTGKSRALTVMGSICYKPFFASGASTTSPIFHILDSFRGTLVLDEADFRFSDEKSDLVKILNNGNMRGFPVLRTAITQKQEFDPRAFSVYGPKLIGMRYSFDDEALESRFISENMGGRSVPRHIPRNLPKEQQQEARVLRRKLLTYRFRERGSLVIAISRENDTSDRIQQITQPLLAVVKDPSHREKIIEFLANVDSELRADRADRPEGLLFAVLEEMLRASPRPTLPIAEITRLLIEKHGKEFDRPITTKYVGYLLRKRLYLTTYKTHGSYVCIADTEKLAILGTRFGLAD